MVPKWLAKPADLRHVQHRAAMAPRHALGLAVLHAWPRENLTCGEEAGCDRAPLGLF